MVLDILHSKGQRHHDFQECHNHEGKERVIVVLADASSEPHAVMIELEHTVAANMAVRCPRRPKDPTDLTIFKLEEAIALSIYHVVENFVGSISIFVSSRNILFLVTPISGGDYPGVRKACFQEKIIQNWDQDYLKGHCILPSFQFSFSVKKFASQDRK